MHSYLLLVDKSCPSLSLDQVKLDLNMRSEYVIRTQPSDEGLSTVESAVHAVAMLENRPDIVEVREAWLWGHSCKVL